MELRSLVLGIIQTNVYFIRNSGTGEMLIIDPADSADLIENMVTRMQGKPVAVLLTHGHFDHFGAAADVRGRYDIPIYCHEKEQDLLNDPLKNRSAAHGRSTVLKADKYVHDGDVLSLAGFEIRVLYTPGHTEGGVCYYFPNDKALFSGDTLFCESYGRTDLPTGNSSEIIQSVRRILSEIPGDTNVYPGHEMFTTIAHERMYNPLSERYTV